MQTTTLAPRHFLLALAVVAIWGSNFVVIQYGVSNMPPLLFAALRFLIAFFPAALFLPRPLASWGNMAAYGLLIGVGQFGLLFIAMRGHISPGLASLVIQVQVFFTIFMAMRISHEKVRNHQWLALALAAIGIGIIAANTDGTTTLGGLGIVLLAALSWAAGNIVGRQAGRVNMLSYMVWTSLFAVPPLFALSLMFDGFGPITEALRTATLTTWAAVVWQSVGNTLFGYAAWAWLLSRYPAATITPMALLVPVFGMATSSLVLGESFPLWKMAAMALVMGGLALNILRR